MESIIERLKSTIQGECLQILGKGLATPQQVQSALLSVFIAEAGLSFRNLVPGNVCDLVVQPLKKPDMAGQQNGSEVHEDRWEPQIAGSNLGARLPEAAWIDANRMDKNQEPIIYFLDIAGEGLHDLTKAGSTGRILRGSFDGRPLEVVTDNQVVPDGIDVSMSAQRLFWTNMGYPGFGQGHIKSSNLDGTDVRTIVAPEVGGVRRPKQIHVDEGSQNLYFCDREGLAVLRCAFDGSDLTVLVRTGDPDTDDAKDATRWCVGVTLDFNGGHLYWSQKGPNRGGKGKIYRAGLDVPPGESPGMRSDIEELFHSLSECVDLEIDVDAGMLYWTDRGEIPLGNSLNCGYVGPERDAYLANVHPLERKLGYRRITTVLHEPIGIKLDKRAGKIYVADLGGSLYRFNLDGTGRETCYEGLGVYTGLTVMESQLADQRYVAD